MSAKLSTIRQKPLVTVDLSLVVYRKQGVFFVNAPQLNIWSARENLAEAIEDAVEGLIGALEVADEQGNLHTYLKHHGFSKKGSYYSNPEEKSRVDDFVSELEWPEGDTDRDRYAVAPFSAVKYELVQGFTKPREALAWQGTIQREPAAHAH